MNTGVVAQMTISVQPAFDALEKNSLKDFPMASSTLNMSAENLRSRLAVFVEERIKTMLQEDRKSSISTQRL